MQQALQKAVKSMQAPVRVWTESALLSFIASSLFYAIAGTALGPVESVIPVVASAVMGTAALISIYKGSPRDWSLLVHFFKHWHRANGCRMRRRERESEERRRLEKLEEEREQARRVRLCKLTRRHHQEQEEGDE